MATLVNFSGKSFIKLTPAAGSHMPPMLWDKAANTASSGKWESAPPATRAIEGSYQVGVYENQV